MRIEEIKPGMVFRENDKRSNGRIVRVTEVDVQEGVIVLNGKTKSRKPERFHKEKRGSGYTLAQDLE